MMVLYIILGIIAFIVILLHFSVTVYVRASSSGVDIRVKYLFFTVYPRKKKQKKNKKQRSPTQEDQSDTDDDELSKQLEEIDLEDDDADFDTDLDEELSDGEEEQDVLIIDAEKDSKLSKKEIKAAKKQAKKQAKLQKRAQQHNDDKNTPKDEKQKGKLASFKEMYERYKPLIPMGWKYFKKLVKAIRFCDTKVYLYTAKEDAYKSAMFYGKLQIAVNNALSLLCRLFTVKLKAVDINCGFNEDKFDYNAETAVKVRPSTMIAIGVCVLIKYLIFRVRLKAKDKAKDKEEAETEEVKKSA